MYPNNTIDRLVFTPINSKEEVFRVYVGLPMDVAQALREISNAEFLTMEETIRMACLSFLNHLQELKDANDRV